MKQVKPYQPKNKIRIEPTTPTAAPYVRNTEATPCHDAPSDAETLSKAIKNFHRFSAIWLLKNSSLKVFDLLP